MLGLTAFALVLGRELVDGHLDVGAGCGIVVGGLHLCYRNCG